MLFPTSPRAISLNSQNRMQAPGFSSTGDEQLPSAPTSTSGDTYTELPRQRPDFITASPQQPAMAMPARTNRHQYAEPQSSQITRESVARCGNQTDDRIANFGKVPDEMNSTTINKNSGQVFDLNPLADALGLTVESITRYPLSTKARPIISSTSEFDLDPLADALGLTSKTITRSPSPSRSTISSISELEFTPPAIIIKKSLDFYKLDIGSKFEEKGRSYTVISGPDGRLRALEDEKSFGKSLLHFFTDRIFHFSLRSRESQLNALLPPAPQARHFRVDMDNTLVFREKLPKHLDQTDYAVAQISRHGKQTKVFINTAMFIFLQQQKSMNAKVSITSTGGWEVDSTKSVLKDLGLDLTLVDNKITMNKQARSLGGVFQKSRALGARNNGKGGDNSINIIIDDQVHQRLGFDFILRPTQFQKTNANISVIARFKNLFR